MKLKKNKPVKSSRKDKKYMELTDNGIIHFGAKNMEDFRQHGDKKRQKSYCARAKGIRNGKGELTYKDKNTANYWSYHWSWKCEPMR